MLSAPTDPGDSMIIVRPVREDDLDSLYDLAREAYPGMTTLPPDRDALAAKIALSSTSVARSSRPTLCVLRT